MKTQRTVCRWLTAAMMMWVCGSGAVLPLGARGEENSAIAPDANSTPAILWEISAETPSVARVRRDAVGALRAGDAARLDVAPGTGYAAIVQETYRSYLGNQVRAGRIVGRPGSAFTLVQRGAVVLGDISVSATEHYLLGRDARGQQIITRVTTGAAGGGCACAANNETVGIGVLAPDPVLPRSLRRATRSTEANGAAVAAEITRAATVTYPNPPSLPPGSELPTFDLLVVYTPAARDGAGGDDAVQALAELAIADANQCYANSGINVRGRLVGVTPVDYQESGSIRADVDALATTDDGILDEVHPLRDQLAADFVCLFTNRASVDGYNGYALIMQQLQPDWEETAFSAINVGSVLVDHLFAHEIGHNMGCDHDRQNTTGYHLFPFSEGWRFHGRDGLLYRDVMAYPPGVSTPNFSNPRVAYLGARTGSTNAADNVRTINASAPFFVDFRSPDGLGRVSVAASVPATSVKKPQLPGQFTIARSGAVNAPLEVFYQVGGSAVGGVDYATLPASVTIAAGEHSATLDVTLLSPPPAAYASKTVTLEILPMDGYALGNSPQALVTLEGARYRPTGR